MKVIRHAVCLTKPVKGETLHWSDNWKQRVICWRAWSFKIIILPCRYCTCTYSIYILYKWHIRTRYSFDCTLVSLVTNVQASRYVVGKYSFHMFNVSACQKCAVSYYGEAQHGMLPFMCHRLVTFNVGGGYILRPDNDTFLWVIYVINKWLRCQ